MEKYSIIGVIANKQIASHIRIRVIRIFAITPLPLTKSNKISLTVAALILLFSGLIVGHSILKTKTGSASMAAQLNYILGKQGNLSEQDRNIDTDNDGLPDWLEKVYKSDPKNPDTDGDGYLDGEEVASGYDPTKKAPDDALPNINQQNPRPLPKNLTEALNLKLARAIAEGKIKSFDTQNGQPLDEAQLENEAGLNQAIEEAMNQTPKEFVMPVISDAELKISKETGKDQAVAYFSALIASLGKISSNDKSEIEVFIDALENNNFSELDEYKNIYDESRQKLKEVPVPKDLIQFHKGILGVLSVTSSIYAAIKDINQDPLKASIALIKYKEIDTQTNDLLNGLLEQINKY